MSTDSQATVAIVGAGFSGTIVGCHLLRSSAPPMRVVLIDSSGTFGRGVAYGTSSPQHLLNVPAGRMSAFAHDEDSFLRFAQQTDPAVTGGSFVPRMTYGRYLEQALEDAIEAGRMNGHVLERVVDEVVSVDVDPEEHRATMCFARREALSVDQVVLAMGNLPPANPPLADPTFYASERYIANPWSPGALDRITSDAPIVLLGTGLTMLDTAIQLAASHPKAIIHAISRRGLLPQPHRPHGAPPSYGHFPPALVACSPHTVAYLHAIRTHAHALEQAGLDWREVMGSLRPLTARLWETLDTRERQRFMRHARPHWDAHRHRVASEVWNEFERLRNEGRVQIHAARVHNIVDVGHQAVVQLRRRGESAMQELVTGTVINCTGPDGDLRSTRHRLMRSLLDQGLVRTDALGLGFETDAQLSLIDRNGTPSPVLSLVGPQLKGQYWEATAVPELRGYAARAASHVAKRVAASFDLVSAG